MCSLACSLAHSNPVIHLNIGFHGIQRFISACSLAHLSWDKLVYFCMLARSFSPEYAGVYQLARSNQLYMCSFSCSLAHSDPVIYVNIGFHGIQRFISARSLARMSQSDICRLSCSLAHSAQNMQVYISLLARSLNPVRYIFICMLARSFRSSYPCRNWLSLSTKVYISLLARSFELG